nr:wd40 repeat-containing protein hos15 [Quercus suber]
MHKENPVWSSDVHFGAINFLYHKSVFVVSVQKLLRAEKDKERAEKDKEREKQHEDHTDREMVTDVEDKVTVKPEDNGVSAGPEPMDLSTTLTSQACEIPSSDVTILEGRTSEVCACAWSPTGSLLASGLPTS